MSKRTSSDNSGKVNLENNHAIISDDNKDKVRVRRLDVIMLVDDRAVKSSSSYKILIVHERRDGVHAMIDRQRFRLSLMRLRRVSCCHGRTKSSVGRTPVNKNRVRLGAALNLIVARIRWADTTESVFRTRSRYSKAGKYWRRGDSDGTAGRETKSVNVLQRWEEGMIASRR
jgi:hypothetical protein